MEKPKIVVEKRDRRFAKGMVVAVSCEIYKFANLKETYKVQSESDPKKYYIVKFLDDCPVFCTCKDWEVKAKDNPMHLCKHMRAVVLADQYSLIKDESEQKSKMLPRKLDYERDRYDF